jgi:3-oxoacyl-[acyl-carrier protein] reductase
MPERKVAVVTGSATGVGAATVLGLARRGYDVVINYTKSEAEAAASAAACAEAGADTLVVRADVADDAACRSMVGAAVDRWGRIDALVNNAQVFHDIYAVNLIGPFQMIRACAPELTKAKGAIVNVSSMAGALGIGTSAPYIASKGALNALTLNVARMLAPDVRVNAVCPGLILSRWFASGAGEGGMELLKSQYERAVPLERTSTPAEVADAVIWLIDGAATMTGELLLLDSGMHLGKGLSGTRTAS